MTENLYLGNVITKGATTTIDPLFMPLTDRAVTIRPSEPEAKDLKYYMDLIYYNRVNSLGDILTSLVYVGDFRTSSPDNTFTYVPENMFRHNNAEIYINVSDDDSDCVSPSKPSRCSRQHITAWPVPLRSTCSTNSTSPSPANRSIICSLP